nr:tripartite tricarboxylate transporter permease [Saccharomonospora sp. CUA-673]
MIQLVAKRTAVADKNISLGKGWARGARDVVRYKGDVLRGSGLGVGVGILPGVGATAGAWLAYGQAQALGSRRKGARFGQGDPRGVIAPSAASNGIESGALIPTLLFGVPGAAPFALLLGVLLIFGIQPGPDLIEQDLDLVYFIVWSFAIASVVGAILAFFMARPLARLSYVSFPVLAAALVPLLFMSGFQEPLHLGVFYTMLLLGIVGWLCKISDIPRAPFLIAYVLAIPLERYYYITVSAFEPGEWMTRPFVIAVALLLVIAVCVVVYRNVKRQKVAENTETDGDVATEAAADSSATNEDKMNVPPFVGVAMTVGAMLFFVAAFVLATDFSPNGQLFPYAASILGFGLGSVALVNDLRQVRRQGGFGRVEGAFRAQLKVVGISILWLLAFVWLVFLVGMYVGTAVFALVFLRVVARMKPHFAVIYVAAIVGALYALERFAELMAPVGWLI